jgi:hypothetical protein
MVALFKYFAGVAVILFVVVIFSAMITREIFVAFPTVTKVSNAKIPRWNSERLKGEVVEYVGHGSLSPIYPATPGKELLGKPAYAASVKRINVRHALQLHKLPPQLYPGGEGDNKYPQQSLSYTEVSSSPPRMGIISRHEIY